MIITSGLYLKSKHETSYASMLNTINTQYRCEVFLTIIIKKELYRRNTGAVDTHTELRTTVFSILTM